MCVRSTCAMHMLKCLFTNIYFCRIRKNQLDATGIDVYSH